MYRLTLTAKKKPTRRTIAAIVTALIEATKRIPDRFKGVTFFSDLDIWRFILHRTEGTCVACDELEGSEWPGGQLRTPFPYLTILGLNTIGGPVNGDGLVHPNCRCRLERSSPLEEPKPEVQFDIIVDTEVENPEKLKTKFNNILNELPTLHVKKGLRFKVIKENPYSPYGEFDGLTVSMREDALESEKGRYVLYHEVGHVFFYDKFNYNAQMKWMDEWSVKHDEMPTSYAKSRFEEGFAECYALYYSDKKKLTPSIVSWFDRVMEEQS